MHDLLKQALGYAVLNSFFGKLENGEIVPSYTVFVTSDNFGNKLTSDPSQKDIIETVFIFYFLKMVKRPDMSENISEQTDCFTYAGVKIFEGEMKPVLMPIKNTKRKFKSRRICKK